FQKYAAMATADEMWFHRTVLKYAGLISMVSIIFVKLFSRNNLVINILIYSAAIITGILNGKRTLFAFIILGILLVDIIKSRNGSLPIKKIILSILSLIIIFVGYAFLIDKHTLNVSTI